MKNILTRIIYFSFSFIKIFYSIYYYILFHIIFVPTFSYFKAISFSFYRILFSYDRHCIGILGLNLHVVNVSHIMSGWIFGFVAFLLTFGFFY